MTLGQIARMITKYQADHRYYPFTCRGGDDCHELLHPEIDEGRIYLLCPDCGYVQHDIPISIHNLEV